eukprot:5089999-Pleurochrysis_carterae.AAC.3
MTPSTDSCEELGKESTRVLARVSAPGAIRETPPVLASPTRAAPTKQPRAGHASENLYCVVIREESSI